MGKVWIALSISPFLVGFSSDDSTGWSVGAGASNSRTQYVTGCSPKYYSMRQTEIDARIDYVKARNPEHAWSPVIQLEGAAGGMQTRRTLMAEERGGSVSNGISDTLYIYPPSERVSWESVAGVFRAKVGFAWRYVEISAGVLGGYNLYPFGGWYADDQEGPSDKERWTFLPCGGVKIIPWKGYYGFYNLGHEAATLQGAPYFALGLGHHGRSHDFSFGVGGGLEPGTKALIGIEKRLGRVTWVASGSIFLEVPETRVTPLRPGDWADLGLAFRIPLRPGL